MINSINNTYNRIMSLEKQGNKPAQSIATKEKEDNTTKCDVIEISKECLQQLQNQKDSSVNNIDKETTPENAAEQIEKTEEAQATEESHESTSSGTSMGINAGKLARKLAAAKTREQVEAVMQEIRQDIDECEAGRSQGATVDESSLKAAQNLLSQASQKMSQVSNRESTLEENMAFLMAGLM